MAHPRRLFVSSRLYSSKSNFHSVSFRPKNLDENSFKSLNHLKISIGTILAFKMYLKSKRFIYCTLRFIKQTKCFTIFIFRFSFYSFWLIERYTNNCKLLLVASVVFVLNSEMSVNIYNNFKLKSKSKQTKNEKFIKIGNHEDSIASVLNQILYAEFEEKKVRVDGGREVTFIGEVRREHTFFLFFPLFFLFVFLLSSSSSSFRRLSLYVQEQPGDQNLPLKIFIYSKKKKKKHSKEREREKER